MIKNNQKFDFWNINSKVFDVKDKMTGITLLHYSSEIGAYKILKRVKKYFGSLKLSELVLIQSNSGKTCFHFAAQSSRVKVLKFLITFFKKFKKDILFNAFQTKINKYFNTPLMCVLESNR
jgi:ankyrin repeat protein